MRDVWNGQQTTMCSLMPFRRYIVPVRRLLRRNIPVLSWQPSCRHEATPTSGTGPGTMDGNVVPRTWPVSLFPSRGVPEWRFKTEVVAKCRLGWQKMGFCRRLWWSGCVVEGCAYPRGLFPNCLNRHLQHENPLLLVAKVSLKGNSGP